MAGEKSKPAAFKGDGCGTQRGDGVESKPPILCMRQKRKGWGTGQPLNRRLRHRACRGLLSRSRFLLFQTQLQLVGQWKRCLRNSILNQGLASSQEGNLHAVLNPSRYHCFPQTADEGFVREHARDIFSSDQIHAVFQPFREEAEIGADICENNKILSPPTNQFKQFISETSFPDR